MDSNSKSEETDRQNIGLNVPQRKKNTMSYKPHGPCNRNVTSEDFDQFLSVYEFFGVLFLSKKKMFFISSTPDWSSNWKVSLKYLEMIVSMNVYDQHV